MAKRIKLLLFFFICCFQFLFAENNDLIQNQIPKSPEAKSFLNYNKMQVSEYSGRPNISIPIYNLEYRGVSIPLEISYQGDAIKVSQEASWVGLGWNLMAGGCINFIPAVGRRNNCRENMSNGDLELLQNLMEDVKASGKDWGEKKSNEIFKYKDDFYSKIKNLLDQGFGEQDFYKVNVLGLSLMFYIDPFTQKTEIIGPLKNKCLIEKYGQDGWCVVGPDKTKYIFSSMETSILDYEFTSAWFLSEIITPDGYGIHFSYEYRFVQQIQQIMESFYIPKSVTNEKFPYNGYSRNVVSPAKYQTNTPYLKQISCPLWEANFSLSNREDLNGALKLDSITIRSKVSNRNVCKYSLQYRYLESTNIGGDMLASYYGTESSPFVSKRLQLLSFSDCIDKDNVYSFKYKEQLLPKKTSSAQDFWGYYNGNENKFHGSFSLIPSPADLFIGKEEELGRMNFCYSGKNAVEIKGANRLCSEKNITACMLEQIIYPTGGYSVFTFEPHEFHSDIEYYCSAEHRFNSSQNFIVSDVNHKGNYGPDSIKHVSFPVSYKGKIEVLFIATGKYNLFDLYQNDACAYLSLKDDPRKGKSYKVSLKDIYGSNDYNEMVNKKEASVTLDVDVIASNYVITAKLPNNLSGSVSAKLKLNAVEDFRNNNSVGGGVRVRSIANYDVNNSLVSKFVYDYSSGSQMCPVKPYEVDYDRHFTDPKITGYDKFGIPIYSFYKISYDLLNIMPNLGNSISFFDLLSNSTIGYSSVSKYELSSCGDTIKTIKTNFVNRPMQLRFSNGKYMYLADNDKCINPSNGNLLTELTLDQNNDTLKLVQNSYRDIIYRIKCGNVFYKSKTSANIYYGNRNYGYAFMHDDFDKSRYSFYVYPLLNQWTVLDCSKITTFVNGVRTKTNRVKYFYNENVYRTDSIVYSIDNQNEMRSIKFKYPNSLSSNQVEREMYAANCVDPLIEEASYVIIDGSSILQNRTRFHYRNYSNVFKPYEKVVWNNGDSSNGNIVEYQYDGAGNLVCQILNKTEIISYIWGYDSQYPIAEIKGLDYSNLWNNNRNTLNLLHNDSSQISIENRLLQLKSYVHGKGGLMTYFLYAPMVGLTKKVNPNGTEFIYEYDKSGRLIQMFDKYGNTIGGYNYNYGLNSNNR